MNVVVGEAKPEALISFLQSLSPASCIITMNVQGLDAVELAPKTDDDSGALVSGLLPLAEGTGLLLDETQLAPGQFSERATRNLQVLMSLAEHQLLSIELSPYHNMDLVTDHPLLVLSSGKSILKVQLDRHDS